jgi:hypothetical protein
MHVLSASVNPFHCLPSTTFRIYLRKSYPVFPRTRFKFQVSSLRFTLPTFSLFHCFPKLQALISDFPSITHIRFANQRL